MPSKKNNNKKNENKNSKKTSNKTNKKQIASSPPIYEPNKKAKSKDLVVNFTYLPNTDEKDEYLIGSWIIKKISKDTGKYKGGAKVCSGRNDPPIETYNAVFDILYNDPTTLQKLINNYTVDINKSENLNASLIGGSGDMNVIAIPRTYMDSTGNNTIIIDIREFNRTNYTVVGPNISHFTAHRGSDVGKFQAVGFKNNVGSSHIQTDILRKVTTFGTRWNMCATFDCNKVEDLSIRNVDFHLEKQNIPVRNPSASPELQNCLLQHIDSITDFMCNEIDIKHLTTDMELREMLIDKLADVCVDIISDKNKIRVDQNTIGRRVHGKYRNSRYSSKNNWTLDEV
jgi:hypothetical protein